MKNFKHISFTGKMDYDGLLEKAGVEHIGSHDRGMYGNRYIMYTYANKLWLGSGYLSFSVGSSCYSNYCTKSSLLLSDDISGMTEEDLKNFNYREVTSLPSEEKEALNGYILFPEGEK